MTLNQNLTSEEHKPCKYRHMKHGERERDRERENF